MAEEINNLFGAQDEQQAEQTAEVAINEQNAEESATEQECDEGTEEDAEESTEQPAKPKKESKPNPYEVAILTEMQRRAEQGDELLAAALQSKDKTIKDCFKYVTEQARKKAVGQCAMVEDAVVYGWAHHYYIESKETIEKECPAMKPHVAPKVEKTAEQKKQEETTKKVYANPLLAALMKKGAKMSTDGEIAVTKTTERKDKDGNVLFTRNVKTDAEGTKTTTIERNGQKYTMTEFALF